MTLCRALRQPGMKVVTSEPLGSDSLFTKSRHERVTWLLFCASAATSSPGRDNGLKSGGYTSCVNPAPLVMSFYTFEVSGHGRTERFADRCARVKAILLRDRFDHCSHTSDEVVQITACLAWSLLLKKWNIRIRFRTMLFCCVWRTMVKGCLQSINLSWHFCLLYTFRSENVTQSVGPSLRGCWNS